MQTRLRLFWPNLGGQPRLLVHRQPHPSPRAFTVATSEIMAQILALYVHPLLVAPLPFPLSFSELFSMSLLPSLPSPLPILEWPLLFFQLPGLGMAHPHHPPTLPLVLCPHPRHLVHSAYNYPSPVFLHGPVKAPASLSLTMIWAPAPVPITGPQASGGQRCPCTPQILGCPLGG